MMGGMGGGGGGGVGADVSCFDSRETWVHLVDERRPAVDADQRQCRDGVY